MALVAGLIGRTDEDRASGRLLEANPTVAHEIGRIVEGAVERLRAAFPREVRNRKFCNVEWRAASYPEVADRNILMGLDGR